MEIYRGKEFLKTSNDIRFAFQFLCLPGIEDSPDQLVGFCLLSTQSNPCGQLPVAGGAKKGPGHTGQINRALHNPLQVHAQQPAAACFLVEGEIGFAITAGYHDQAAASNLFATGILVNQSITPWIARTGLCGNFLLPERRWPFLPTLLVVLIGCQYPGFARFVQNRLAVSRFMRMRYCPRSDY